MKICLKFCRPRRYPTVWWHRPKNGLAANQSLPDPPGALQDALDYAFIIDPPVRILLLTQNSHMGFHPCITLGFVVILECW